MREDAAEAVKISRSVTEAFSDYVERVERERRNMCKKNNRISVEIWTWLAKMTKLRRLEWANKVKCGQVEAFREISCPYLSGSMRGR